MLYIDGSQGEGGGQVVRSSLALSVLTQTPVAIGNIRAGRKQPGLKQQHVTAAAATARICGAEIEGAEVRSRQLVFRPGEVLGGEYQFDVGTAGSVTLVLQTILPALLVADTSTRLVLKGGTHNAWAPPFDFLAKAFLPLVGRMGPRVSVELERPGFYPAGGGVLGVEVEPATRLFGFDLLDRGQVRACRVRSMVAELPIEIGQRECTTIRKKTDWPQKCFQVEEVTNSLGPGNVVMIEFESQNVTEVFTGFGRRGVRAEHVASSVLREAREYLKADVPVGPHLADQLILLLGVSAHQGAGGGSFRTQSLTKHSTTQIELLQQFLNIAIDVTSEARDAVRLQISAPRA